MSQCPACNAEIVTYEPQLKRFHDGARGEHSGTAVCPLKVVLLPAIVGEKAGAPPPAAGGTTCFSLGEKDRQPPPRLRSLAVARRAFNRSVDGGYNCCCERFPFSTRFSYAPVLYLPGSSSRGTDLFSPFVGWRVPTSHPGLHALRRRLLFPVYERVR